MLKIYDKSGPGLVPHDPSQPIGEACVWLDLINPTEEEDSLVEKTLGISVPTRAEMREIEPSSRFYQEDGAAFMTAFIVFNVEDQVPASSAITFILAGNRLVTVRYVEPKAFPLFMQRIDRGEVSCSSAASLLIGLVETMIHRMADLVERIQDEVDKLARSIFDIKGGSQTRNRRLDTMLKGTGREGDLVARAQESAMSLSRLLNYFADVAQEGKCEPRVLQRIQIAERDVAALVEHMRFLTARTGFLLDATLGMISTEQNQIIKLFSVMAVMLMPPTLIASVYGMNFRHMPELDWIYGYPLALGLMVLSGLIPYIYFRRKGWL